MGNTTEYQCLYVEKGPEESESQVIQSIKTIPINELSPNEVRIQTRFSSINYKDALCAQGHPGVARSLPIIPGIDGAGVVLDSNSPNFKIGDEVMVFHADFGTATNGGLAEVIQVPADWVYSLPEGMSLRQSMSYGTAGYTAAQSIEQLLKHDVTPESGRVLVTGATGGVGILSIAILKKLGFAVVAVTGKPEREDWLKSLGAIEVVSREDVCDSSSRPLLKGQWAGAVDSVGGNTLATVLRMTKPHGCVTACGLVGGSELVTTVYPFILRGISLVGIDTAGISRDYRSQLWEQLAGPFAVDGLEEITNTVSLSEVTATIDKMLRGDHWGRTVVAF